MAQLPDDPLEKWNELTRTNTENEIVSLMFRASFTSVEPLEEFATWLLVGAAAVASFLIANAEKITPLIHKTGFLVCGAFLCLSCTFGLLSKMYAIRCKIGVKTDKAIGEKYPDILKKHNAEEREIKKVAQGNREVETEIRMERILTEFYAPLPSIATWWYRRSLKKHEGNPQIGHMYVAKNLFCQGVFTYLQGLMFLGFLVSGFVFASLT